MVYALMAVFFVMGVLLSITSFIHAPAWAQLAMGASGCFALVSVIAALDD